MGAFYSLLWILLQFIISLVYMSPWLVAKFRGHPNALVIFWINLLLGWTLLGWVAAFILALWQFPPERKQTDWRFVIVWLSLISLSSLIQGGYLLLGNPLPTIENPFQAQPEQPNVTLKLVPPVGSWDDHREKRLIAVYPDGTEYTLETVAHYGHLDIEGSYNFDGNGTIEHLIYVNSAGGNAIHCCWKIIEITSQGEALFTDEFGYAIAGQLNIVDPDTKPIEIRHSNSDESYSYFYKQGIIEKRNNGRTLDIPALIEAQYAEGFRDQKVMKFDIDDHGTQETITCTMARSAIGCKITWGKYEQEIPIADNLLVRRFGVLASKTKGYHDLVMNADIVYVWNGNAYVRKQLKSQKPF
jgi:hypothetical protein